LNEESSDDEKKEYFAHSRKSRVDAETYPYYAKVEKQFKQYISHMEKRNKAMVE
jgi:hypothetical protein